MKKLATLFLIFIFTFNCLPGFAQWTQCNGPDGGQVNCLTQVGSSIWAGTTSGVFISDAEGATWLQSPLIGYNYCSSIICTHDTIVVIFMDYNANGYFYPIYSILSFNNGLNWSQTAYLNGTPGTPPQEAYFVHGIIYQAEDQIISRDYGISWQSLYLFGIFNTYGSTLYFNSSEAFVQVQNAYTGGNSYFKSNDGFQTYQLIDSFTYRYNEIYAADSALLITASIFNTGEIQIPLVVRTTNYGLSWDTVLTGPANWSLKYYATYDNDIYFEADTDIGIFYYYVSHDEGFSWHAVNALPAVYPTSEVPLQGGDKLFVDDYTDIYKYVPALDTFYSSQTGLVDQGISCLASNKNVLFAGTAFDLSTSFDAGLTWTPSGTNIQVTGMVFTGDTVLATGVDESWSEFSAYFLWSFDNGHTWDSMTLPVPAYYQLITSIAQINNRIFIGGDWFIYSDDFGATWNTLPDLPDSADSYAGGITAFANILFTVDDGGNIYKYDTSLSSWMRITGFGCSYNGNSNGIEIADSTMLAYCSGSGVELRSADTGKSWQSYSTSLFNVISHKGIWYAQKIDGDIYVSYNQGWNWYVLGGGSIPFIPVGGLTVLNGIVYSGTYTSGVWKYDTVAYNQIKGAVFNDLNNNGIRDSTEPGLAGMYVYLQTDNLIATTDSVGRYSFNTDFTGDTLKPVLPSVYCIFNPPYYLADSTGANYNFGLFFPPGIADLAVSLTNEAPISPNVETNLSVVVPNKATLSQAPVVALTLDTSLVYISAQPEPSSVSGNILNWNLDTLGFLQSQIIRVTVVTDRPVGTRIICSAIVYPVIGDTMPANNYDTLNTFVVGSYSSNEKVCKQGDYITPGQADSSEEMVFIIRFQNTGGDSTNSAKISDTLSPYLDLSTFRLIASSEPMQTVLSGYGVVDFYFDNLRLPPPGQDELNSRGFVKYGIRCKQSVVAGDAILNTANIYFDSDTAIVTNTTITLVSDPITEVLSTTDLAQSLSHIDVFPNPTNGNLNIDLRHLTGSTADVKIYSSLGQLIISSRVPLSLYSINMAGFASDLYYGLVTDESGEIAGRFRFVLSK